MNKLLEMAKERTGLTSNNQVAIAMNVKPELVSTWNTNKSHPNGLNTLILADMARLSPKEAIKLLQNGYSTVSLLIVTSITSIALLASISMRAICILCKIKVRLRMI